MFGKFSTLFKKFLRHFVFLFFLWKPYNSNVCAFNIFQRSLKVKVKLLSCVWLFVTQWTIACQAPPSMDFPGKYTGVGCHFFLQEIFPTQGSNLGPLHCRQALYHLSHQGIPKGFWGYPQFFAFFSHYYAVQKLFPPSYLSSHLSILLPQLFSFGSF